MEIMEEESEFDRKARQCIIGMMEEKHGLEMALLRQKLEKSLCHQQQ